MIENINNIQKKITTIQNNSKKLTSIKPEMVKEFEEMYKQAITKQNESNEYIKTENYHPYLKTKNTVKKPETIIRKKMTYNEKINDAINIASKKHKVSENLIRAVIKTESSFNQYAVSKAGAMGLMQLMPQTAKLLNVIKPFDIYQNIEGGTHYLRMMLDKYDNDLEKSIAAYNAGPHNVDAANGIPDFEETINYVKKIKNILLY